MSQVIRWFPKNEETKEKGTRCQSRFALVLGRETGWFRGSLKTHPAVVGGGRDYPVLKRKDPHVWDLWLLGNFEWNTWECCCTSYDIFPGAEGLLERLLRFDARLRT